MTINSAIVTSFLVPTYSSIFRSVTMLSLDAPGLPVDLLPHLHRLEVLTASHLPLPAYYDDVDLPSVHTLRHLTLRSVSIQWMSGRTFHLLESCTILFPLCRHILHTFRTTLLNCKDMSFEGYPLNILTGISAHKLSHLFVKCPSSYTPQGNQQLALSLPSSSSTSGRSCTTIPCSSWSSVSLDILGSSDSKPKPSGASLVRSTTLPPWGRELSGISLAAFSCWITVRPLLERAIDRPDCLRGVLGCLCSAALATYQRRAPHLRNTHPTTRLRQRGRQTSSFPPCSWGPSRAAGAT